MLRGTTLGIVVTAIVLSSVAVPVGGVQSGLAATEDVNPDSVFIGVDVRPDGSAEWAITYRVRLDGENETTAYEEIVADVENNSSTYLDRFASRINATVDSASAETGRSMRASNFSVDAEITGLSRSYGTTTYTFVWHGFAATDGETLEVGDALSGFFLDSDTTMRVTWPTDYASTAVQPPPTDSGSQIAVWEGPMEFTDTERLRIVLEPTPPGTTSTPAPTTGVTDGSNDALVLVALVLGVLLVLSFITAWYYRVQENDGSHEGPTNTREADTDVPDGTATPTPDPDEAGPPEELLSNEERVTRFLTDHGGRAKQQEVVEGLNWTEAKTSQVLSDMESAGTIEKFRIGRENVVKLPEDETNDS